jgi:AraC family transcriptional activator of pyochelin receptor
MYQLTGTDFREIITREFTAEMSSSESSGSLPGIFDCHTKSLHSADFDLLAFSASFENGVQVADFQDTTHVSMHFQLAGRSNASISCLNGEAPMKQGHYNLFNCVDPISSFVFPAQKKYDYLCVGLKPSFFDEVLEECGVAYHKLLEQSLDKKGFSIYKIAVAIDQHQIETLRLIQHPPVADNLKEYYIKSKIRELIMLSLNAYSTNAAFPASSINESDIEKLHDTRSYLSINYLLPLRLETISRHFLLNEFKLKKGFKDLFGQTVFGYIHERRMRHAFHLLNDGGLSIGEIAAIVGYTSNSSFIRSFRLYFGYPPGATRKAL